MKRALVLACVLGAGGARANVWQHASEPGPSSLDDVYQHAMDRGDEFVQEAHAHGGASLATIRHDVQQALDAYRLAAKARPSEGEPWYRIGEVIYEFFLDCTRDSPLAAPPPATCNNDPKRAEEMIAAWDEFEKRSPLDPRLSFNVGVLDENAEVLFQRAIEHTKLIAQGGAKANKAHLEAAARDYEKIVERIDSSSTNTEFYAMVVGNLAETYMMLDRLDDAVETYREAERHGARSSAMYGEAVALDRDERGGEALDIISRLGENQVQVFHEEVDRGAAFFVPEGEKFYYFALQDEAFGHLIEAARDWQLYIASGAHPEFQPRAKQHLDALASKHIRREVPHLNWFDE